MRSFLKIETEVLFSCFVFFFLKVIFSSFLSDLPPALLSRGDLLFIQQVLFACQGNVSASKQEQVPTN